MKKLVMLICIICITASAAPIKVGYLKGSTLADINHDTVYGTEVDIIRSSIDGVSLKFIEYPTATMLLDATKAGDVDVGIGGVSITPDRVMNYNFTMPTAINDIGVCYNKSNMNNSSIFSNKLYKVIIGYLIKLLIILSIFAHLIWMIERYNKDDSNFDKRYGKGISDAYWWSLVTSSTVGYGDLVPKTFIGRLLGGFIIIAGVTWFGLYIGSISNAYETFADGCTMSVGNELVRPITKSGSSTCDILDKLHIKYITYDTLSECFDGLYNNSGDCVIFDSNKLTKYSNDDVRLKITDQVFNSEYVGIVYNDNFEYIKNLNRSIVLEFLNTKK